MSELKRNLGQARTRIDGKLKVTGAAIYPADEKIPNLAYGRLVTSSIGNGRIVGIDYRATRAVPGVLYILTYENIGEQSIHQVEHMMAGGFVNSSHRPMSSPEIFYGGQIVALVAAESLEAAAEGAEKLVVRYEHEAGVWELNNPKVVSRRLSHLQPKHKDRVKGDFAAALDAGKFVIDEVYETPIQHHNPIELFTTTCIWDGPRLTVYEPTRYVTGVKFGLAQQLGMEPENIRVIAKFLGGHFGSKLGLPQYTALTALAAKRIGRPLTLATTRSECFTVANHRPDTRHRIRLATDADGKLMALGHEATSSTSRFDNFLMEGCDVTSALYACPNIETRELSAQVDRNTPGPMRAPPEVPYLFALESAVDELAIKANLDPIEWRRRNLTNEDPITGKKFTSHLLMRCFDEGSQIFNWQRRNSNVGSLRNGDWLIGLGCATAARPVKIGPVTVRIKRSGEHVSVETAHHEIGNGLYTILAMAAADGLNVPMENVKVKLGDTNLPAAGVSGGSATTTTLINAVAQGCTTMKANNQSEILVEYVPPSTPPDKAAAAIEQLRHGHQALSGSSEKLSWTFGAQFAEVHIHSQTCEMRVAKLVGVFAAGRLINPLTAHSQATGGMIWGLSSALLEASEIDSKTGLYINDNLADYLVPTNADVAEVIAKFIEDDDREVNPEGIKGIGEIGIIGVNAAIANAVYNATGKRVRSLPIKIEDLLA